MYEYANKYYFIRVPLYPYIGILLYRGTPILGSLAQGSPLCGGNPM